MVSVFFLPGFSFFSFFLFSFFTFSIHFFARAERAREGRRETEHESTAPRALDKEGATGSGVVFLSLADTHRETSHPRSGAKECVTPRVSETTVGADDDDDDDERRDRRRRTGVYSAITFPRYIPPLGRRSSPGGTKTEPAPCRKEREYLRKSTQFAVCAPRVSEPLSVGPPLPLSSARAPFPLPPRPTLVLRPHARRPPARTHARSH